MTTTATTKPVTAKKATKGLNLSAVKETEAKEPKAATFAAFLQQEAEADKWVKLGEFLKEHSIDMTQGLKAKLAKHLKNDLGFDTKDNGKGTPASFQREDLEGFFEVEPKEEA